MRHRRKFNHLSRKSAHRKAMLANMASSLIIHKRIKTTLAKAKALRTYVEPLITRSKEDSTHSRRMVFRYLQNKEAVTELFREISVKVADRPGGYTRILKLGSRMGDNAEMCMIELVDFNENLMTETKTKAKTTRRGRRGGAKKTDETAVKAEAAAPVEADVVEEKTEEAVAAESTTEEPAVEEPAVEEPKAEEPKAEIETEEPNAEVEAPAEAPVKEEKPAEEAPAAEAPADEPKAEAEVEAPVKDAEPEEKKPEAKPEEPKASADQDKKEDEEKKSE
jgi:large subunit ribosomal protein L17